MIHTSSYLSAAVTGKLQAEEACVRHGQVGVRGSAGEGLDPEGLVELVRAQR